MNKKHASECEISARRPRRLAALRQKKVRKEKFAVKRSQKARKKARRLKIVAIEKI